MLALRLTRGAGPAVQTRRLLVAAASAGTGFLLLSILGHALGHPAGAGTSALRLAWCAVPLAATVQFALAVARTDPGTRPRPGLAAIGLGPVRLMAISATTTALSTLFGSMLALLLFLHLRGDLTGLPFDSDAAEFLAAGVPLPLPAALTLLALVPVASSVAVALSLRPRETRLAAGARGTGIALRRFSPAASVRETFGAYGRFGARGQDRPTAGRTVTATANGSHANGTSLGTADGSGTLTATVRTPREPVRATVTEVPAPDAADSAGPLAPTDAPAADPVLALAPAPPAPKATALPWGAALLAAGLAVEAYAGRSPGHALALPGGPTGPAVVLAGWVLTALGLAVAGPSLTHLCGRLLQAAGPGALRLLAGRGLMEEASRIGRPLGILCAVASGAYALSTLYDDSDPSLGPLTVLGASLVAGCALATLCTAAVEARQARADTAAALRRLGAPSTALRGAAALRAGALAALFVPLTVAVAVLAALPLTR
ncbi:MULTISPECIES: hypothetical protein [unclassified Streptomyces]|uniref:hypothetical protein n=1 Tax=unclassified Streptomyces TaxID=2593676 RepID=UPI00380DB84B